MAYKVELSRQDINDILSGLTCYIAKIMRVSKPGSIGAKKMRQRFERLYYFFEGVLKG